MGDIGMNISMNEYYGRELYPRMLRHLDKYGDVGGWRQMSLCYAISHYIKARWNEFTSNRSEGGYPNRAGLLNEVASIDPAIAVDNHSIRISSCYFFFPESGDIREFTLHKNHNLYTLRKMRGVRACDMAATLYEMAARIESIDDEVNELCNHALEESSHLGPIMTLDIPDWVLSKVSEEIIRGVVADGKPYNLRDEYSQRCIYEWVGRVYEIILQDMKKDYPEEDCVFFPKYSDVVDLFYNSGLVFVRKNDDCIDAGGIQYYLKRFRNRVEGIWINHPNAGGEIFINLGCLSSESSLPSLYILKRLAEVMSINQELIFDTCLKAYAVGNKELVIKSIQTTVNDALKLE